MRYYSILQSPKTNPNTNSNTEINPYIYPKPNPNPNVARNLNLISFYTDAQVWLAQLSHAEVSRDIMSHGHMSTDLTGLITTLQKWHFH